MGSWVIIYMRMVGRMGNGWMDGWMDGRAGEQGRTMALHLEFICN